MSTSYKTELLHSDVLFELCHNRYTIIEPLTQKDLRANIVFVRGERRHYAQLGFEFVGL